MSAHMTKVKVEFFGSMREVFTAKEREIELSASADIGELLVVLCDSYQQRQSVLGQDGQIRKGVIILRNGRNIRLLDGVQTRLKEGDTIAVFPLAAGG